MSHAGTGNGVTSLLTRRQRYRQQTIEEIKSLALAQVVAGGEAAVSLNAIAKSMAMSPGALYRYFDNRDDLVAELVVDAYGDLADHVHGAVVVDLDPPDRLRAVGHAYRQWALHNPNTYRLLFETTSGSGSALAAERVVPAAQRGMDVFLQALTGVGASADLPLSDALERQVIAWGRRADHADLPASVLYLALSVWTRLHGILSLEIGQHLLATGVDAALLFDAELDHLVQLAAS